MLFVKFCLKFSILLSICNASNENETVMGASTMIDTPQQQKPKIKEFDYKKTPKCELKLQHPAQAKIIQTLLKIDKLNLLQYKLHFVNYTSNPLKFNNSIEPLKWFRTASGEGLILLSLPFNHDLLSLKTLSLGTTKMGIDLIDQPANCMESATAEEQLYSIQYRLIRDFRQDIEEFKLKQGVCRKVFKTNRNFAEFVYECILTGEEGIERTTLRAENNTWLRVLDTLLLVVRVVAMAYLPCLVISMLKGIIKRRVPYIVKLTNDSFIRKRLIITDNEQVKEEYRRQRKEVLDLGEQTGFPYLRNLLQHAHYPLNKIVKVRFRRYDILVDYHRTVTEDRVKVGLLDTMVALVFRCKIKHLGSFVQCCQADMNKFLCQKFFRISWINFFRKVAAVLLILILPLPYYLRLLVYYFCGEEEQVQARKELTQRFNLSDTFANSFVLFLTPTHPVLIAFYVVYFVTGCIVSLAPHKNIKADRRQVLRRLVNSVRDLDEFSVLRVVNYVVSIATWPFYRFGLLGCLVAPLYWLLAFPLVLFICLVYSVPSFYLVNRMLYYCVKAIRGNASVEPIQPQKYQVHHSTAQKKLLTKLKVERFLDTYKQDALLKMHTTQQQPSPQQVSKNNSHPLFTGLAENFAEEENVSKSGSVLRVEDDDEVEVQEEGRASCFDAVCYVITTLLCVITFCGIVFIGGDLVVFVVEMIIFTIMGIIVNAGYVLRHVLVAAIVLLYIFDNFFILEKKYLKMNKVIFAEVSKRVKNLDKVTSLPSFLQENRGFKAQDSLDVADYENCDSVVPEKHWMINDLVLFMDSEDTPRIPVRLFKKVCSIKVPGVPGPVYLGQLDALKQLAKVLFMVFLVVIAVMVFGEVYSISSTNQLIATVAGSFIPLLFKSFLFNQDSNVEVNSLTFKCHMDELIERFHQNWPIHDMVFEPDEQNTPDEVASNEKTSVQEAQDAYADFAIVLPKDFTRQAEV